MIKEQEIQVFLDGLARKFENRPFSPPEFQNSEGWGQFLDGPPQQTQIGPYGTCSGLIVRALAGRGNDSLTERVGNLLNSWWAQRTEAPIERKLFSQTNRVAFLFLALRIANLQSTKTAQDESRDYLLATLRPDKMWGNYNLLGVLEDTSPRFFPTAITLLAFALFREDDSPLPEELFACADKLEERLLATKDLPALHIAAAAAAILAVKGKKASSKIRRYIRRWAYGTQPALPELGVYFYDLEFVKAEGSRGYDRDYFIIPTEILIGIAGFQRGAPAYLRLRAESSLNALVKNLRGFDGFYRPDNEQRVSSVNQCWVSMYLALAAKKYVGPGLLSKFTFFALKKRPDTLWTDIPLLILCSGAILLGSFANFPSVSFSSVAIRILTAVLAFIAGRLYAPTFLKKVFVGRE